MKTQKKSLGIWGGIVFSVGIVLLFLLSAVMIWGDLEASLFISGIRPESNLGSLRCPVLITENETGTITAVLNNPANRELDRYLMANISEGYSTLVREVRTNLTIPPTSKQKVEWKIYPEDAAYNQRIILFRVYVNPRYPHPSMGANCGVIKLGLHGLSGNQLFMGSAVLSLSFLTLGAVLIERSHLPPRSRSRSAANCIYAVTGSLLAAGVLSYFGFWVLGLALLVLGILLIGILVTRVIFGDN
jgi:hypothetical protein